MLFDLCFSLIDENLPGISNISNVLAVLYHELDHVNWAGLYLLDPSEKHLYLGPFQGKAACTKIPVGKGVVGTCAERKTAINVPDVHAFPGHIACDAASRSEAVFPLFHNGKLVGILDIDSDQENNFDSPCFSSISSVAGLLGREVFRLMDVSTS